MDIVKAKRGRVKGMVTRIASYCDSITAETTLESLEGRLEKLNESWVEFNHFQDQMYQLITDPNFTEQETENEQFETKYFSTKEKLSKAIKERRHISSNVNQDVLDRLVDQQSDFLERFSSTYVQQSSLTEASFDTKLPKFTIPPFSGNYDEWISFRDLFKGSVHENTKLTATQKFHYLKSFLKDEAASLLRHIPLSEANYKEAWDRLNKRYDKKGHIVKAFIRSFLNLSSISTPSASALRRLTDGSDEVVRGLRALGDAAESRDPWLIYLLMGKVDPDTRQEWAEATIDIEYPTVNQLFTFLEKRCVALEDSQAHSRPAHSSSKPNKCSNSVKSFHSTSPHAAINCQKCKANHLVFQCPEFQAMDIVSRRKFVNENKLCFNCLRGGHNSSSCKSKRTCNRCKRRHHTLVHLLSNPTTPDATHDSPRTSSVNQNTFSPLNSIEERESHNSFVSTHSLSSRSCQHRSLLPTVIAHVLDAQNRKAYCRILLDSGSQVSFITEALVKRLGLKRKHARIPVTGLSSIGAGTTKGMVTLELHSRYASKSIVINAYVLNKLTSLIPSSKIDIAEYNRFSSLQLADPSFNEPGPIDIIVGADKIFHVLEEGSIHGKEGSPLAQLTLFGWIIAGELPVNFDTLNTLHGSLVSLHTNIDIDRCLQRFWELENISHKSNSTPEEQEAEKHFQTTHIRTEDGRYHVELPFKIPKVELGDSFTPAMNRLKAMERRFVNNLELKEKYTLFMREYIELGHMEKISDDETCLEHSFYLPHHAILRPDSSTTKLRVVFDGSSKSSNGNSLNDALLIGPSVQRDLFSVCLRFRRHTYVFTADIEKMYRQILTAKHHRDFQRILWRESPNEPVEHYRLCTVTYGTCCAPFLAVRSLQQLAYDYAKEFPQAAKVVLEDFYVDDVMTGANSVTDVISLKNELSQLLSSAGFKLRKWCSNCWPLLKLVPHNDCELSELEISDDLKSIKALGLRWHPSADVFSFKVVLPADTATTKRKMLSDASRIFDHLGFLTPVTVSIKILFQALWLQNLHWDDLIPENIAEKWRFIRNELSCLEQLRIPRRLWDSNQTYEIHGFCDASQYAFAAVIYCRSSNIDGTIDITLIAAKSKVAPLKQISIPKLELCAAVMLSQLLQKISQSLQMDLCNAFAWTDSQIVLQWLSSIPRRWKTFVANRTSEILDIIPRNRWRHVPSESNPADCASRGVLPSELLQHSLWWNGPQYLQDEELSWPISPMHIHNENIEIEEERSNFVQAFTIGKSESVLDELSSRVSTWNRLIRSLTYCYRYIDNGKRTANKKVKGGLRVQELARAKIVILKHAQHEAFKMELRSLLEEKSLPPRSKIIKLTPFIDKEGILRVGGRISNSNLPFSSKHPVILPKGHVITQLIIKDAHISYLHAGTTELFSILRQSYWILGCRNMVRKVVHECMPCFKQRQSNNFQMMGNLPAERVTYARPFLNVGFDYPRPLTLRLSRGRNPRYVKGYIALFLCLTTKALHLELVSDLTTEAFLAALKRFFARRGKSLHIFSDNGTNFKGAHRLLSDMHKLLVSQSHNDAIHDHLSTLGINWSFIPPSAPHFGGLWEAGVKAVKQHLKRVIGKNILTYEEMYTVLVQIEALLNSRPLCPMSDNDLNVLTPAHFLIGHPYTILPEIDFTHTPQSRLKNWELLQNMTQGFWKRWHSDYLTSLQQRPKWYVPQPEVKEGDLVVLKEPNLPPSKWTLARVMKKHPGQDGHTRVVTIRSSTGSFTRPITKIVPLPTP